MKITRIVLRKMVEERGIVSRLRTQSGDTLIDLYFPAGQRPEALMQALTTLAMTYRIWEAGAGRGPWPFGVRSFHLKFRAPPDEARMILRAHTEPVPDAEWPKKPGEQRV